LFISDAYDKVKYLLTVKKIPDALWNEARLLILPGEKSNNSIGCPAISLRKVLDGILYVLRTGCQCQWEIDVDKGVWFRFDMS
jgi:hypothetical protein